MTKTARILLKFTCTPCDYFNFIITTFEITITTPQCFALVFGPYIIEAVIILGSILDGLNTSGQKYNRATLDVPKALSCQVLAIEQ